MYMYMCAHAHGRCCCFDKRFPFGVHMTPFLVCLSLLLSPSAVAPPLSPSAVAPPLSLRLEEPLGTGEYRPLLSECLEKSPEERRGGQEEKRRARKRGR